MHLLGFLRTSSYPCVNLFSRSSISVSSLFLSDPMINTITLYYYLAISLASYRSSIVTSTIPSTGWSLQFNEAYTRPGSFLLFIPTALYPSTMLPFCSRYIALVNRLPWVNMKNLLYVSLTALNFYLLSFVIKMMHPISTRRITEFDFSSTY